MAPTELSCVASRFKPSRRNSKLSPHHHRRFVQPICTVSRLTQQASTVASGLGNPNFVKVLWLQLTSHFANKTALIRDDIILLPQRMTIKACDGRG